MQIWEVVRDGNTRRREILLVGAHYDSVMGSPGANDNASGVAALLEISRKFAAIEPSMTVRFVAFALPNALDYARQCLGVVI